MKKAFIITGAQSSGNHLMTDILVSSGCVGTVDSDQPFWDDVDNGKDNVVWRGSMPKGGIGWWNIERMIYRLSNIGYKVFIIVMHRDITAMAMSQVKKYKNISSFNDAHYEIIQAYNRIYHFLRRSCNENIIPVSYESLVYQKEDTLKGLSNILGIELNHNVNITNENRKWY